MPTPPNIVVLMSDQQRWDSLGCNGNAFAVTPHMDAIAAEGGINFANACTPFPICTPARASMWDGRAATRARGHAQPLRRAGRAVLRGQGADDRVRAPARGRLHGGLLRQVAPRRGQLGPLRPLGRVQQPRRALGGRAPVLPGRQVQARDADRAHDRVPGQRDRARAASFVAVQSWYPPHNPFTAPAGALRPLQGARRALSGLLRRRSPRWTAYVGRIRAALETHGHAENTLVIFLSDHGETFNLDPAVPAQVLLPRHRDPGAVPDGGRRCRGPWPADRRARGAGGPGAHHAGGGRSVGPGPLPGPQPLGLGARRRGPSWLAGRAPRPE